LANPSAWDRAAEACEDSTQSCSLSPRDGYGQSARGTQSVEAEVAARHDLVRIGLVAGIEDQRITRRVEYPMERDGQLDHTEVVAEVPARRRDLVDEELPDRLREISQLVG